MKTLQQLKGKVTAVHLESKPLSMRGKAAGDGAYRGGAEHEAGSTPDPGTCLPPAHWWMGWPRARQPLADGEHGQRSPLHGWGGGLCKELLAGPDSGGGSWMHSHNSPAESHLLPGRACCHAPEASTSSWAFGKHLPRWGGTGMGPLPTGGHLHVARCTSPGGL